MNATTSVKKKGQSTNGIDDDSVLLIGEWCELPPRNLQTLGSATPGDRMAGLRFAVISSHFHRLDRFRMKTFTAHEHVLCQ